MSDLGLIKESRTGSSPDLSVLDLQPLTPEAKQVVKNILGIAAIVWRIGEPPKNMSSSSMKLCGTDSDPAKGFSAELRPEGANVDFEWLTPDYEVLRSSRVRLPPSITIYENAPPSKPLAIRDHVASVSFNNRGEINLIVNKSLVSHWQKLGDPKILSFLDGHKLDVGDSIVIKALIANLHQNTIDFLGVFTERALQAFQAVEVYKSLV